MGPRITDTSGCITGVFEVSDTELEAMAAISGALGALDEDQQSRVLRWAAERFGVTLPDGGKPTRSNRRGERVAADDEGERDSEGDDENGQDAEDASASAGGGFEHFAELYDSCSPSTTSEKALVGAYWVQELGGKGTWTAFEVNKLLKDLGHGDTKIARTLGNLISEKPAKVLQIRKSGKTRQARKTYKLTAEGIKSAKAMLRL